VSAELARELARRLGVGIDYVTFDAAGKVFDALKAGLWDIAFLAIDPVRAAGIDFTAPYPMFPYYADNALIFLSPAMRFVTT
jgi:polar amino acid transport system substrate-binding protein